MANWILVTSSSSNFIDTRNELIRDFIADSRA